MHFLVDLVLSLCAVNVVLLMMNFNPLIKMFEQLSLNNIRIMSASKNGKNFNRFAIWLCHISSYPLNIYMFFFVVSSIALFALDNSKSPQHSAYNVMNTTNNFHTSTLSRISVCTVHCRTVLIFTYSKNGSGCWFCCLCSFARSLARTHSCCFHLFTDYPLKPK